MSKEKTLVVGFSCGACGSSPCMLICPLADPFAGCQEAENASYEANARYDAISEANDAYARDMAD